MEETAVEELAGQKKSKKIGKGSKGGGDQTEHETHIWTERERRKKMRNMFSNLHALLPDLPPKADKSTVVDEAVRYIKSLEQELQSLENQKLERLQHGSTILDCEGSVISTPDTQMIRKTTESRETFLSVQGASNNFPTTINSISAPNSDQTSCFQTWFSPNVVLNTCGDDAQISLCSTRKPGLLTSILCILQKHNLDVVSAHISSDQNRCIYMIHARIGGASCKYVLSAEDTFKLAAGEMNLWLLSC